MSSKSNKKFDFSNNFENVLSSTDPEGKLKGKSVDNIPVEKLVGFKNHPFKIYEGVRFTDMVESIKANGIIMPIIVRPLDDDLYEILSGHNRVKAAKYVGLETIPTIIRKNLSEDEALLIVTETNLIQRSFTDLAHSERAAALSVHHEAVKSQGKRTDLINEIENLFKNPENISNNAELETSVPMVQKLNSREKTAQNYGLDSGSVARYLRINKLINELKQRLDNNEFAVRAAFELSYISQEAQERLNMLLNDSTYKLDIKKAEFLRAFSKDGDLGMQTMENILLGVAVKKRNRASLPVQSFKLKGKVLSKYFKPEDTQEDIEAEIIEALEFLRAHKNAKE